MAGVYSQSTAMDVDLLLMTENGSSRLDINALKWFPATDFMDESGCVPDSIFISQQGWDL